MLKTKQTMSIKQKKNETKYCQNCETTAEEAYKVLKSTKKTKYFFSKTLPAKKRFLLQKKTTFLLVIEKSHNTINKYNTETIPNNQCCCIT